MNEKEPFFGKAPFFTPCPPQGKDVKDVAERGQPGKGATACGDA